MTDTPDLTQFEPPEYLLAKLNTQIRELMHFALRPYGLKIERTATSRLIDKMATRGLVAKEALENDRRFMRITITEAGRTAYEAADKAAQSARQRLFAGLSDDDITQMLRMLRQMQANSERPQHLAQVLPIRATAS